MKTLKTLFFLILSNVCFGQIIEIIEMPQYTKESIDATNKLRTSLGLNELKDDAVLDSAAKHHAYYLAYSLLYASWGGSHYETIDIPNFKEKLNPEDRAGRDVNEIQYSYMTGCHKKDSIKGTLDIFKSSSYMKGYFTFSDAFIGNYKKSAPHYKIITKEGVDIFGTFTLLMKIKTPEFPRPCIYMITVTDSRPL